MAENFDANIGLQLRREGTCIVGRIPDTLNAECPVCRDMFTDCMAHVVEHKRYVWHHWTCFLDDNRDLRVRDIANFDTLAVDLQIRIDAHITAGDLFSGSVDVEDKVRQQSEGIQGYRQLLAKVDDTSVDVLLQYNGMSADGWGPRSADVKREALADFLMFGVGGKCPACQLRVQNRGGWGQESIGHLLFKKCAYVCHNGANNTTVGCLYWTHTPARSHKLNVPRSFQRNTHTIFLQNYQDDISIVLETMPTRVYIPALMESLNQPMLAMDFDTFHTKSTQKCVTLIAGQVVIPELKDHRVYSDYTADLSLVNFAANCNSYVLLRLLAHKSLPNTYSVYRAYGLMGSKPTEIKREDFNDSNVAIERFRIIYTQLTGNAWKADEIQHFPLMYSLVDINYINPIDGQMRAYFKSNRTDDSSHADGYEFLQQVSTPEVRASVLSLRVSYDSTDSPMGPVSKQSLSKAYGVLGQLEMELQNVVPVIATIVDLSQQIYRLIPHSHSLTPIDTIETIARERELLNRLRIMRIRIKSLDQTFPRVSPIETLYQNLRASVRRVDMKGSEALAIINDIRLSDGLVYVKDQRGYSLEPIAIFAIDSLRPDTSGHSSQLSVYHATPQKNITNIVATGLQVGRTEFIFSTGLASKCVPYTRTTGSVWLLRCHIPYDKIKTFNNYEEFLKWLKSVEYTFPPDTRVVYHVGAYSALGFTPLPAAALPHRPSGQGPQPLVYGPTGYARTDDFIEYSNGKPLKNDEYLCQTGDDICVKYAIKCQIVEK